MGGSWSNNNSNNRNISRRRHNSYHEHYPPPPYYYYSSQPQPLMPQPQPQPQPPQGYFPPHQYYSNGYTPANSMLPQPHHPFYATTNTQPLDIDVNVVQALPPPPPYTDHETAKKVRNDVNLHKHTLQLYQDPNNPDHHLISFVFDALFPGRITIFYIAREEEHQCRFVPLFPEAFEPITFPFQKGVGQKFCQPSGTGIDLGFFDLDDLSNPSPEEDIFPLVICAESTPLQDHDTPVSSLADASPHMQITQAVLEKNSDTGSFQVKVVRQILWIDQVRYELRELYGIGNSTAPDFDRNDPGKECVICMTEPKDTAVLPCRHMCMCGECAKALRVQSNNCPICRQPIEQLIEIKINNDDQ
ncbi:putative aminoacyltransferase, E1 ubiquitin-activating enzyme [Medicago truncatula]|uniref:RING-type E3 ubiquitin transferase n=1 Tax=Medicago truncatula TaxID=3880 RepID=A0A072US66_MEDTR|nr:probable E3 ubiquitin-protein ligase LUL4 [Medicago truncatula]KEH32196.1 zinc finger, C3HC4 type (RING finger) protein [Medicago truncatula]RHN64118.1 putative aminoacyltransferase, E1 ubiquitin-activating enzyme [Medicago truncatula]